MDELKAINLDERAIRFATDKLSQGDIVSRMIADALRHRAKSAWTLLPVHVNNTHVYDFETGGACNLDSSEGLSELIYQGLISDSNFAWILLDNISTPSEPIDRATIGGITTPFGFENELFQLLNSHMVSVDAVHETFRFGGAYPFVGFIAKINQNLLRKIKRNQLSQEDMQSVIDSIVKVLLGAYDEESYLVFELPAAA